MIIFRRIIGKCYDDGRTGSVSYPVTGYGDSSTEYLRSTTGVS